MFNLFRIIRIVGLLVTVFVIVSFMVVFDFGMKRDSDSTFYSAYAQHPSARKKGGKGPSDFRYSIGRSSKREKDKPEKINPPNENSGKREQSVQNNNGNGNKKSIPETFDPSKYPILKLKIDFGEEKPSLEDLLKKYKHVVTIKQWGGFGDTVFLAEHPFYIHAGTFRDDGIKKNIAYWFKEDAGDKAVIPSQEYLDETAHQILEAIRELRLYDQYLILHENNTMTYGTSIEASVDDCDLYIRCYRGENNTTDNERKKVESVK